MLANAGRTGKTIKNIFWGYIGNLISVALHFVSRTVFIYTIGVSYLGINGLFSSILGMLSLSELGIGTAISFSLYKPVAEGNIEKTQAIMALYKKAYVIIALIIATIGTALIPFLPSLIKETENIPNLTIYYVVFLFNTVSSYFVSYKYAVLNAEQKGYVLNNFNSVFNIAITVIQVIVLIAFRNYLCYLLVQSAVQLIQKIIISKYLNRLYPYLKEKDIPSLAKEEVSRIKKNVLSLFIHKIGEISIYQTDNIIISSFISVILVGKISNYNLIITSVSAFITIIFNSVTSSFGNLIAIGTREKQKEVLEIYNFLGFWLYGFASVCYFVLFQPFVAMWAGRDNLIDNFSLVLIILSQYFTGQRVTINNVKTAGGIFEDDKFVSLMQGGINLVVSLIMVKLCGLPGVYIGTLVSGLFANVIRPIVVYRKMFGEGTKQYFTKQVLYFCVVVITCIILKISFTHLLSGDVLSEFVILLSGCIVFVNLFFLVLFYKTKEFQGIISRLKKLTNH